MCCGCAMVTFNTAAGVKPNLMQVASSFGFGIMVLAQIVGPLSGGHINCAVSFCSFSRWKNFIYSVRCLYLFSNVGLSIWCPLFYGQFLGHTGKEVPAHSVPNSWNEDVFSGGEVFLAELFGYSISCLHCICHN